MRLEPFGPLRVPDIGVRITHMENYLSRVASALSASSTRASVTQVTEQSGTAQDATTGGSSGSSGGSISESQITWDADDGHNHDGDELGRAITLTGDVSGTNLADTVDKLKGVPLSGAPAAGDANRFIKYDNGLVQFVYSTVAIAGDVSGTNEASVVDKLKGKALPAAPGASQDRQSLRWNNGTPAYEFARFSTLNLLGSWTKADISTLGAADAEIDNSFSNAATKTIANPMPADGAITTLSVILSGDVGGAGVSVTFTLYNNGVATAITGAVTGAAGTEDGFTTVFTPVTFSQGNRITVKAKIVGAVAAVQAVVTVWGYF